jgi:hypothetical protein
MQSIAIIEPSDSFYENKLFFENNNTQILYLKNICDMPIIYKVKSSIYKNCIVRPCTGLIKKGNTQRISIDIFNENEIKSNIKFLINIIQINNVIPSDIWTITPTNNIIKIKFQGIINSFNQLYEISSNQLPINKEESTNEQSINESTNEQSIIESINEQSINESNNEQSIIESNDEKLNKVLNDEKSINESNKEELNNDTKYIKEIFKKLNKINKNKPNKETSELSIQCNIDNETSNYIQYIIYFLIFFFGLCVGIKLTM